MTNDEIIDAVVQWVAGVTGTATIRAYQSGPRPALPYIMVNLTGQAEVRDNPQGIDYTPSREDEDPPTEDTAGNPEYPPITAAPVIETEWRFSIHGYAATDGQATDVIRPIKSAQRLSEILEPMNPNLFIHETSQFRNVPEWVNSAWEPRANIDLFLRGLTRDGFVISTIDDIEGYNVTREGSN